MGSRTMATIVGSGENGDYDLGRSLALYDVAGDLPLRSRELWSYLADGSIEMAREFWRRYAQSPEVRDRFDDARIDSMAQKIAPYIAMKFERIEDPAWTGHA